MKLHTPVPAFKFSVVPNYSQGEIAEIFTRSVRSANIDFINKTLTVRIMFSTDEGHTDAINEVISKGWLPSLHFENDTKVFMFTGQLPPVQPIHSLEFDYSNSDVAMHVVIWNFSEFKISTFKDFEAREETLQPAENCITIEQWHSSESKAKAP